MNAAIPSPGGSVGLPKFAVYAVGGGVGIALFATYLLDAVPDQLVEWNVGPVKGTHVFLAAGALVGAALAAKVVNI